MRLPPSRTRHFSFPFHFLYFLYFLQDVIVSSVRHSCFNVFKGKTRWLFYMARNMQGISGKFNLILIEFRF